MKRTLILFFATSILFSCTKIPPAHIEKTILLYQASNNNLTSYSIENINSLMDVENGAYLPDYFDKGESGDVLLVYQHLKGESPKLFRLSQNNRRKAVKELIYEYENHNSMDPKIFREILNQVNILFPAQERGLILSSHGTGWLPIHFYVQNFSKSHNNSEWAGSRRDVFVDTEAHLVKSMGAKSFGEDANEEMEIFDLTEALPTTYSYIIFDACLMGGIEVAYQLRNLTDYVMASQTEILADGFPYNTMMSSLFNANGADLVGVAKKYYDLYNEKSEKYMRSATISLVETKYIENLANKAKLILNRDKSKIGSLNMAEMQGFFRYNNHWFYDFLDFYKGISSDNTEYQNLEDALNKCVVYKASTEYFFEGLGSGFQIKRNSGLSTYIPNPENSALDNYYKRYDWNKDVQIVSE